MVAGAKILTRDRKSIAVCWRTRSTLKGCILSPSVTFPFLPYCLPSVPLSVSYSMAVAATEAGLRTVLEAEGGIILNLHQVMGLLYLAPDLCLCDMDDFRHSQYFITVHIKADV